MKKISLEAFSSVAIASGICLSIGNQYFYKGKLGTYSAIIFMLSCVVGACYDIVCSSLTLSSHPVHASRKVKGLGLCYVLLVPVASVLAFCTESTTHLTKLSLNFYIYLMLLDVISHQVLSIVMFNIRNATWCEYSTILPWFLAIVFHTIYVHFKLGLLVTFLLLCYCFFGWFMFSLVLERASLSLTLTESTIIKQSIMIYLFHFVIWFYRAFWLNIKSSLSEIDTFTNVAVFSALLVLMFLVALPHSFGRLMFYPLNIIVASTVSYPILLRQLNANFVVWTCDLILGEPPHAGLTFFWSISSFVCTSIVLSIVDVQKTSQPDNQVHQVSSPVRKVFHLAAIIVFLPGFVYSVPLLRCAATCACIVFIMIESARVLQVFPFNDAFCAYLEIFRDKQDQGCCIMTPIYLLVGFSLPLWLSPSNNPCSIKLYSGLIALGVGDSFASLIGCSYGHRKWPGSHRSVEGFVSYVSSCIVVFLVFLVCCTEFELSYQMIVFVSSVSAAVESFTSHVDNLLLPIFMFILLT